MDLSIRHWLAERHITINQITGFSAGQMAGIAYRIVQDMEAQSFVPFEICTLAEVLELPLGVASQEILSLALLTESLLRSLCQRKPLKRNEGTWLAFQIAYLQALQQIISQEANLQRLWLDRSIIFTSTPIVTEVVKLTQKDIPLAGLLKNLSPGKLTDTQAEQALSLIADSLLVQQMNNATVAWLVANGAEEPEAKLITQRLVNSLPGHLVVVIANNAAYLPQLQKFVCLGNLVPVNTTNPESGVLGTTSNPKVGDKIDLQREYYRARLLQNLGTPLLMESFALKDIYIPLTGVLFQESSSEPDKPEIPAVDLMTWAQQQLGNLETIAVIESAPGYGKTSFCQIWAAQVARELYPTWIPVVIPLRDVKFGKTLVETLNSAFVGNLQVNLANWLEQDYPRCLLLLDGLDELPPEGQMTREKAVFCQQLLQFQSEKRHKVVLTCRLTTLTELAVETQLLKRITIKQLEVDELRQWFQQWAVVQSLAIAQNFFTFLKQAGLFANPSRLPPLSTLVRQPLMLYLLGILHRDGLLDDELLEVAANNVSLRWEIYYRLSCWLLGYPQTDGIKTLLVRSGNAHINRTPEATANLLAGDHPEDLMVEIQGIALQILHSTRQQIHLNPAANTKNLPVFYFRQTANQQTTKIEFSHPKLGEFLCSQAIVSQLQILTQQQEDSYGKPTFILDSPSQVAQHLYNLLGYGILSQEMEDFILEGLRRQSKRQFDFQVFFTRLESFWRDYCQGRWLNEGIAHQAWTYFQTLQNPMNVEKINAAVGLNVFLLLCGSYREAKVPFWTGGNPANLTEFQPTALIELIHRTAVLHKNAFALRTRNKTLAGINLSGISLLQVMLAGANLEGTNLFDAELIGANFSGANLQRSNLQQANLTGANLSGANLQQATLIGANLTGANLTGANLTGVSFNCVNLTNTCLFNATLNDADKEFASLNGALLCAEDLPVATSLVSGDAITSTIQFNSEPATQVWENNLPVIGQIEIAEGVPAVTVDLEDDEYDEYADGETFLANAPTNSFDDD
jgi:hypothetical protein